MSPTHRARAPVKHLFISVALLLACMAAVVLLAGDRGVARASSAPLRAALDPVHATPRAVTNTVFLPLVVGTSSATPNIWRAEYYANSTLAEPAAFTAEEPRVDYGWGEGAPAGLPVNYFSARWTGDWHFEVGRYTFFLYADDGARLWLDGDLLIDAWSEGLGEHQATALVDTDGLHEIQIEYFEGIGGAAVRLHWRRTDLYPQWHGEYFREPWVEGGKVYNQTDSAIQFDWGEGCPGGVPCDGFSVSWEATPVFPPGTHRIYLYADDGYQLYVDGSKVSEGGWFEGQSAQDVVDSLEVGALEQHHIEYNFHDRGSLAEARLWIEYVEQPRWTAEYFTNMDLSGEPEFVREEEAIFYDWGFEPPQSKMPSGDQFSVRWTGERYFHSGSYRFGLFADDGVRLYVDEELLVDAWHQGRGEYHSRATYLDTGYHQVIVEYFENTGESEIRLWWE